MAQGIGKGIRLPIDVAIKNLDGVSTRNLSMISTKIGEITKTFAKELGLKVDTTQAVKGIGTLTKLIQDLNISVETTGKNLTLMGTSASGATKTATFSTDIQGKGTNTTFAYAEVQNRTLVQQASLIQQLRDAWSGMTEAESIMRKLAQVGEEDSAAYQMAADSAELYGIRLEEIRQKATEQYKGISIGADGLLQGKDQIAEIDRVLAQRREEKEATQQTINQRKQEEQTVREYISTLKEQYQAELELQRLRTQGAGSEAIRAQEVYVAGLKKTAQGLENNVKGTKAYKNAQQDITNITNKYNASLVKMKDNQDKATGSLGMFGKMFTNFKSMFVTVVQSGLSWRLFSEITQAINKTIETTKELDKAMVDLQIATGGSRTQAENLLKTYNQIAMQVGSTTTEVSKSAVEWLNKCLGLLYSNI